MAERWNGLIQFGYGLLADIFVFHGPLDNRTTLVSAKERDEQIPLPAPQCPFRTYHPDAIQADCTIPNCPIRALFGDIAGLVCANKSQVAVLLKS